MKVEQPTSSIRFGVPNGIRTRVLALKGLRPRPLDDGDGQGGLAREPRAWEGVTASTNDAARSIRQNWGRRSRRSGPVGYSASPP